MCDATVGLHGSAMPDPHNFVTIWSKHTRLSDQTHTCNLCSHDSRMSPSSLRVMGFKDARHKHETNLGAQTQSLTVTNALGLQASLHTSDGQLLDCVVAPQAAQLPQLPSGTRRTEGQQARHPVPHSQLLS